VDGTVKQATTTSFDIFSNSAFITLPTLDVIQPTYVTNLRYINQQTTKFNGSYCIQQTSLDVRTL